jgi:hypothetical protein
MWDRRTANGRLGKIVISGIPRAQPAMRKRQNVDTEQPPRHFGSGYARILVRFARGRLRLLAQCVNQPSLRDNRTDLHARDLAEALHAAIDAASQVPHPFGEHHVLLMMTGPILRAGMIERCFPEPKLRRVRPAPIAVGRSFLKLNQPPMLSGERRRRGTFGSLRTAVHHGSLESAA